MFGEYSLGGIALNLQNFPISILFDKIYSFFTGDSLDSSISVYPPSVSVGRSRTLACTMVFSLTLETLLKTESVILRIVASLYQTFKKFRNAAIRKDPKPQSLDKFFKGNTKFAIVRL